MAIAANRFGLGARPDDRLPERPRRWLLDSLEAYQARPAEIAATGSSEVLAEQYLEARRQYRAQRQSAGAMPGMGRPTRLVADRAHAAQVQARVAAALGTPSPFVERLVHFWSNHFAVSADKPAVRALAGTLEFEAIRPHVLGRFADMLLAVERHPAMQLYLDHAKSRGPNSPFAQRQAPGDRQVGLNENLAREIMELHTLGVDGGYDQTDVAELARAMTGWTIGGFGTPAQAQAGRFAFRPDAHEPGDRRLLARRYADTGEAQATAMLLDLARHPATARHLARKLARHFAADAPPPALVARLAGTFRRTGGDLAAVSRVLVEAAEPWRVPLAKFKSPWDWLLSALRGLGLPADGVDARRLLSQLGQPVWRPGSPAGWADIAQGWAGGGALLRRAETAMLLAEAAPPADGSALAPRLLPGVLGERTASAIADAGTGPPGLALLISSPEFQRR